MVTRTYEVRTYGCQMNVHDTSAIAGLLDEACYAPVADGAQPDVVVLSTCAVCENADNKLDGNRGSQLLSRVAEAPTAGRRPGARSPCGTIQSPIDRPLALRQMSAFCGRVRQVEGSGTASLAAV